MRLANYRNHLIPKPTTNQVYETKAANFRTVSNIRLLGAIFPMLCETSVFLKNPK